MGAFAARVGRCGSGAGGFRDKTPRVRMADLPAAAAAVLILAVAGEFLLRPDKALENDGTVIASVAEDGATAVAIPQPAEPETVRDALAKAVGLPREQVAGEASSAGRRSLLAAAAGQPAQTAARRRRRQVKSQRRHPVKSQRRPPEILRRRRLPAKGLRSRLPGGPQRGRQPARPVVRGSPTSRSLPTPNRIKRRRSPCLPAVAWRAETAKVWLPGCSTPR